MDAYSSWLLATMIATPAFAGGATLEASNTEAIAGLWLMAMGIIMYAALLYLRHRWRRR